MFCAWASPGFLGSGIGGVADGAAANAGERLKTGQTVAPKRLPTPAVNAIARAPQKVTRMIDRMTGAPPAFAPSAPSRTRHRSETATTSGINCCAEAAVTTASGMIAPALNVAADVNAACRGQIGRAHV